MALKSLKMTICICPSPAWAVRVRSSILHGCGSDFTTQVFCWDSTVDRFLFLVTMSSTSSDSKIAFDSEESEIYHIAEDMRKDLKR